MASPSSGTNDLERNLKLLLSFFPPPANELSASQVLFLEATSFTHGRTARIPRAALASAKDFARRFDELLDEGYSWINMNALGIWNDSLIIVIELPSYMSDLPRDKVPVNFSGPAIIDGKPQWDLSEKIEIVE